MCRIKPTYFDKKVGKEPTFYKLVIGFSPFMQNKELHQADDSKTDGQSPTGP